MVTRVDNLGYNEIYSKEELNMSKIIIGVTCGVVGWYTGRVVLTKQINKMLKSDEFKQEMTNGVNKVFDDWKSNRNIKKA